MAYNKLCKKCLKIKPLTEFRKRNDNGHYRHTCKKCESIYISNYQKTHKEKINEINKKYYSNSKSIILDKMRIYYEDNKEEISTRRKHLREINKSHYNEVARKNYKRNRKIISAKENERYHTDNLFKIKKIIRSNIRASFKKNKYKKSKKTEEILGCNINDFINYLIQTYENNYNEKWNWEYLSKVHIDHIIPLATAKTEEDIIKLCHYTNLQLLKAEDNLDKSNKLNYKIKEVKNV